MLVAGLLNGSPVDGFPGPEKLKAPGRVPEVTFLVFLPGRKLLSHSGRQAGFPAYPVAARATGRRPAAIAENLRPTGSEVYAVMSIVA